MKKQTEVEARSYLKMEEQRPGDIDRERECFKHLFNDLDVPPFRSLVELFGGSGVFRGVVAPYLAPDADCQAWDLDADCCALLRRRFPETLVRQVDSFAEKIPQDVDLLSADFNTWTVLKWHRDQRYQAVTRRLFQSGAKFIQLTDSAVNKIHLNMRAYARVLAVPSPKQAPRAELVPWYTSRVASEVERLYGYRLLRVAYHSSAIYYLFHRNEGSADVVPTFVKG